jgi:hypothetical protein
VNYIENEKQCKRGIYQAAGAMNGSFESRGFRNSNRNPTARLTENSLLNPKLQTSQPATSIQLK